MEAQRLCHPPNEVDFYFTDALGTSRYVYSLAGANVSDFYPFGGERVLSTGTPNHYKFTGKERDSESGLDTFGARYDSSQYGRFITPDWAEKATAVPYADFGDPQTLNLYSYSRNNPIAKADKDGHCIWDLCIVEGIGVVEVGIAVFTGYGLYRLHQGLKSFNEKEQKKLDIGNNTSDGCMSSSAACTDAQIKAGHTARTETITDMGIEAIKDATPAGVATAPVDIAVDHLKDAAIDKMVDSAKADISKQKAAQQNLEPTTPPPDPEPPCTGCAKPSDRRHRRVWD